MSKLENLDDLFQLLDGLILSSLHYNSLFLSSQEGFFFICVLMLLVTCHLLTSELISANAMIPFLQYFAAALIVCSNAIPTVTLENDFPV